MRFVSIFIAVASVYSAATKSQLMSKMMQQMDMVQTFQVMMGNLPRIHDSAVMLQDSAAKLANPQIDANGLAVVEQQLQKVQDTLNEMAVVRFKQLMGSSTQFASDVSAARQSFQAKGPSINLDGIMKQFTL